MSPVIALMFDCCQRVLRGDQQLLSQLRTAGFECAAGGWQFSLPDLHGFLQAQLPTDECCDYQQFIRRLYASDINHRLCEQGAEIALADNQGKIHRSRYCLRCLPGSMAL